MKKKTTAQGNLVLEPSTLTQMEQTSARIELIVKWIQISQMEWVS